MFSFRIKLFLTTASTSVWGPALGAPLSPQCHCWSLPLCHLGWDCDADAEGYLFPGAKMLSPASQVFYTDGEQQKEVEGEYLSIQAGPS